MSQQTRKQYTPRPFNPLKKSVFRGEVACKKHNYKREQVVDPRSPKIKRFIWKCKCGATTT